MTSLAIENSYERTSGALSLFYNWGNHWINDGFTHMKRPVIAAPEHKLHVGGTNRLDRLTVSTGVQYIAGLYTSTSPVAKESFVLWNLRASFKLNRWLSIWAKGENLLAQEYEINAGHPMPRATAMAGFEIFLN